MSIIKKRVAMRKGLLEVAVLKTIARQRIYAPDVLEHLKATEFFTQEGTLYPLLSRLSREGLIMHVWTESKIGPPRKYYGLTDQGRTHLFQLQQYWQALSNALDSL